MRWRGVGAGGNRVSWKGFVCWGLAGKPVPILGAAVLDYQPDRRSFFQRYRKSVIAIVVIAGLLVAVLVVNAVRSRTSGTASDSPPPATTRTSVDKSADLDLHQPFVGTPAAGWPDGAAGIVAPQATPVGRYTAEQVAVAYQQVRQVLITARLDRAVIQRHDFEPFLRLFAPEAQEFMRPEFGNPAESYAYATRIADGFRLLPVEPKANGEMQAMLGEDGELAIRTNYVFAYAFHTDEPDRLLDAMDIVAVDRFQADYLIFDDEWVEGSQGIWPGDIEGYGYSIACTAYDDGFLAPAYSERELEFDAGEDDDPERYFDPDQPLAIEDNCAD